MLQVMRSVVETIASVPIILTYFSQYLVEVKRNENRPIPDDWISHSKYDGPWA
jgi:hypothetical protein